MQPLTPMLVQYLVGLCCIKANPESVEVILGDFVLDAASNKERDVDITVTMHEEDGTIRAFKAYEVKRESRPLDVAITEQLIMKLRDMPRVTNRAIVSASGFTDGAIEKANSHNVELYTFRPWEIPDGTKMPTFSGKDLPLIIKSWQRQLLCWNNFKIWFWAPNGPSSFTWENNQPVYTVSGESHPKYKNIGAFLDELLISSTETLLKVMDPSILHQSLTYEPIKSGEVQRKAIGAHTHTINILEFGIHLAIDSTIAQVQCASITGELEWQRSLALPKFYVIEKVSNGDPFAGAAITEYGTPDGKMSALIFTPNSKKIDVHPTVLLNEEQKNAIRQLKIHQKKMNNS